MALRTTGLFLQRAEDHVEHRLLTRLELVEHRQTGPHGAELVEKVGLPARKDNDPILVDPGLDGKIQQLEPIHGRHLQIDQHQVVRAGFDVLQGDDGIIANLHLQKSVGIPDIAGQEVGEGPVVID